MKQYDSNTQTFKPFFDIDEAVSKLRKADIKHMVVNGQIVIIEETKETEAINLLK